MSEISSQSLEWACDPRHPSKKRYEAERHHRMVEQAVEILSQGSPQGDAKTFRDNWESRKTSAYRGLRDADEVNPYYNTHTFTSHFYDPDTERNINPFFVETEPTAKTEACRFFRLSLAHRYDPKRSVDSTYPVPGNHGPAGYYLGLALHYLTDLGQPMHAVNYGNLVPDGTWRHKNFELTLEQHLDEFHGPLPTDHNFVDSKLKDCKSLEDLVRNLAFYSKKIFWTYLFMHIPSMPKDDGTLWPLDTVRPACSRILPEAESTAAALLLLWARGYDSLVEWIYQRLLGRPSDTGGKNIYVGLLANLSDFTPRKMVIDMGKSEEYFNNKVRNKSGAERRKTLYHDFLNRVGEDSGKPSELDLDGNISRETWNYNVESMVGSQEYSNHYGDYGIPGYQGLSAFKEP